MKDNRICQFAIPMVFYETPLVLAAAFFGIVPLQANKGSLTRGGPPAYVHYIAWHPKFPQTAFNIIGMDGKAPDMPWVELVIGTLDAKSNTTTVAWRQRGAPKDEFLWSSTITLDEETMMSMPGMHGVAGHG